MSETKKRINVFKYIYIVFAILTGILAACTFLVPSDVYSKFFAQYDGINLNGIDPKIFVFILVAVEALIYVWYAWLIKRVVNGKSNGTLLLVLSILSLIAGVTGLVKAFTIGNLAGVVLDALLLALLIKLRGEK